MLLRGYAGHEIKTSSDIVSSIAGRVRGQQLRLFLFDLEEFHGDDRRLQ